VEFLAKISTDNNLNPALSQRITVEVKTGYIKKYGVEIEMLKRAAADDGTVGERVITSDNFALTNFSKDSAPWSTLLSVEVQEIGMTLF
jgi:hypothetical protein